MRRFRFINIFVQQASSAEWQLPEYANFLESRELPCAFPASMAGDSIGCASRKKSKRKNSDRSGRSDCNDDILVHQVKTTRGGLRVYKIVILGDGGVGKSGEFLAHARGTFFIERKKVSDCVSAFDSIQSSEWNKPIRLCLRSNDANAKHLTSFSNAIESISKPCELYITNYGPLFHAAAFPISLSAVTLQFVSHSFLDYHDPTIGELTVHAFFAVERPLILRNR